MSASQVHVSTEVYARIPSIAINVAVLENSQAHTVRHTLAVVLPTHAQTVKFVMVKLIKFVAVLMVSQEATVKPI
jgi:hypothetical protein